MRNIYLIGLIGLASFFLSSCSSTAKMTGPAYSAEIPEVIVIAKSKVGSKYKYGATGPNRFDCSGFIWYVFSQNQREIGRTTNCQSNAGKKINPSNARPGDLLFFGKGRKMQHVGIVVANKNGSLDMVHASSSRGVIVENVTSSPYWSGRIKFAVRLDG